jgi:hypothetical protein
MASEDAIFVRLGVLSVFFLALVSIPQAYAQPKYSADVPKFVTTPDKIETERLGTLEFFEGMPSAETHRKVYDNLDLARGTTVFLDAISITSMYAVLRGLREAGVKVGEVGISETLLDARSLLLTPNTTTIYILAQIDLSDGPVVMNAPPQMLGLIDDAASRYVFDIGVAGPDKGKGGKYRVIPPGYKGDIPDGYYVFKSKTYDNWLLLRAFVKDGDLKTPAKMLHENLNLYPLSQADNPPAEHLFVPESVTRSFGPVGSGFRRSGRVRQVQQGLSAQGLNRTVCLCRDRVDKALRSR